MNKKSILFVERMEETTFNIEELLADPLHYPVPEGDDEKWDIVDILTVSVTKNNINSFLEYMNRLPLFMAVVAFKKVYRQMGRDFSSSKSWGEVFIKHYDGKNGLFKDVLYFIGNTKNARVAYQSYLRKKEKLRI